jgi:hypothetical protein
MTAKERLKARLPTAEDTLLDALLLDAQEYMLSYTGRKELPAQLIGAQVQLAVIAYNRLGIEGESSHAEGGVSRGMEALPADIERQLMTWRIAKVVSIHAPKRG